MQELRLVAVSEDGSYLVLATAGRGTRFTLPVDDRLRAAVRGHFSRLGQYEIEVESPLRPKEIQARIRAGETAEEIAETAGIPVERVRWFEGPVLQEREYMAQQAQRLTIRRQGESSPAPALGEVVEERLGKRGIDLEEVEWDSRKCEDSTWRVRLSFSYDGRPYAAEWAYDPRRRNISAVNEEASRLSSLDLDDTVDDTVTPFLPRRAMKVVGDPTAREGNGSRHAPREETAPAESSARVQELPKTDPAAAERAERAARAAAARAAAEREAATRETAAREAAEREAAERETAEREAAEREAAERETAERKAAEREALALAERQQAAAEAAREAAQREAEEREAEEREAAEREKSATAPKPEAPRPQESPAAAASRVAKPAPPRPQAKPAKPEPAAKPAAEKESAVPKPAQPAEQPDETEKPAAAAASKKPAPPAPEKRPAARKKARGKRASVPSWDEIMFGARRPE